MAHLPLLVEQCGLRVGIVDPGSVNLGGAQADGLPAPIDFAYANTPLHIRHQVWLCERRELGPSIAILTSPELPSTSKSASVQAGKPVVPPLRMWTGRVGVIVPRPMSPLVVTEKWGMSNCRITNEPSAF